MPAEEHEETAARIRWEIRDEAGALCHRGEAGPGLGAVETARVNGRRHVRLEMPLPPNLPLGYYDLSAYVLTGSRLIEGSLRLIVAPDQCFVPPGLLAGRKTWGIAVQLYSVKSSRNWGVGDFTDLNELVEWTGQDLKGGLIGLNPLHALKNTRPYHISPYAPDSRLYLNLLYVDVERVPDFRDSAPARQVVGDPSFQAMLQEVRGEPFVDYDRIAAAKLTVLNACFTTFWQAHMGSGADLQPRTRRGQEFCRFVQDEGETLEAFALFQVLEETMRREYPDLWGWERWPEPYRSPLSTAVGAFKAANEHRIRLYQYIQWVVHEQLRQIAGSVRSCAMPVGLYHDLALGSDRSGTDAWMFQDVFALAADCGCPPDAFAAEGQNWGLPPADPHRLRATGYRMFIQMLRHNLRYCGALRIDHVMALFRLFWIPRGLPASAGTYVHYPAEDLLGILALESVRHQAMVVGEDLGTVPEEIRTQLAAARVLSYRVLYFERWEDGTWKPPGAYPEQALAVVTTHDLPTLSGFWEGHDIEIRAKLGLYPDETTERAAWEARYQDKLRIWEALKAEQLLPRGLPDDLAAVPRMTPELSAAVHVYLARTPSWIVLATLDDVAGEHAQTNFPGTVDTYPNWSRKLTVSLEALRLDRRPRQLAASLSAIRPVEQDAVRR
jgi:4-alpha-glucanotransferase